MSLSNSFFHPFSQQFNACNNGMNEWIAAGCFIFFRWLVCQVHVVVYRRLPVAPRSPPQQTNVITLSNSESGILSLYLESAVLWTVWMRAHCTMCSHARDSPDCLGTKQKTQKKKIWRTEEGSLFLPAVDDASVLFYLFYVQASILYQETITIYPYIIFIHRTREREREIIVMAGGHIDSSHCIRCLIIIFVLLLFFSLQSQIIVFFLLLFCCRCCYCSLVFFSRSNEMNISWIVYVCARWRAPDPSPDSIPNDHTSHTHLTPKNE